MSATTTEDTVTIRLSVLKELVRRVVREELSRLPYREAPSVSGDWRHEGPNDPEGDEQALAEAMEVLAQCEDNPECWMTLDELEAELDRAEAAGEDGHPTSTTVARLEERLPSDSPIQPIAQVLVG